MRAKIKGSITVNTKPNQLTGVMMRGKGREQEGLVERGRGAERMPTGDVGDASNEPQEDTHEPTGNAGR